MIPKGVENQVVLADFRGIIELPNSSEENCIKEDHLEAASAWSMAIEALIHVDHNETNIQLNNDMRLIKISANHNYGLPFGVVPRLLLVLIINEINLTQSPVIRLNKLYLSLLQLFKSSKNSITEKKMNKDHLYDQLIRLFTSQITYSYRCGEKIVEVDFWWNPLKGKKENITSSSTVVITRTIFDYLVSFNEWSTLINFKNIKWLHK